MERFEINKYLEIFKKKLNDLHKSLKIDTLKKEIIDLEEIVSDNNFWLDTSKAKIILQELNEKKFNYDLYNNLKIKYDDILVLLELFEEDESNDLKQEIEEQIFEFDEEIKEASIKTLLSGKYDKLDAILEFHPGAGGTESMDWASILYRMYNRYAQRKNYKVEILDYQPGDEAGIKSATILIKGEFAYGYLKAEAGVHRLVRISPFDSNSRRHTSFCSIDVTPSIKEDSDIVINEEDIKIDVYRSSGAGGQSVNTTDSAVRITHLPTNIVVTCQNERSQIKNRETAFNVLKSKLIQLELKKKEEELSNLKGNKANINFGSQIRSYVFAPYTLVKDHRTNHENGNVNDVIDGNLDDFITSFLINLES